MLGHVNLPVCCVLNYEIPLTDLEKANERKLKQYLQ